MVYDFDRLPDRRAPNNAKWHKHPNDVLPMWIADMDFVSPAPVVEALQDFVGRGVFGYPRFDDVMTDSPPLRELVVERLARRYGWRVAPEALVFVPGVVTGFNLAAHALAGPGGELVVQTPLYPPMLETAGHAGLARRDAPLSRDAEGRYAIDWEVFEAAFSPATRLFLLCNPHNPTGRVFSRDELERMAEICLRHGVPICSDEVHNELVYPGSVHTPIAALAPEIEQQTITLIAPSKTFNLAGLQCSVAIIPNPKLRAAYIGARRGLVTWVNSMGLIAAEAAYRDGDEWLDQLLVYLAGNRDYLAHYAADHLPGLTWAPPEATYLAWLDCRASGLSQPCQCFLDLARVACSDGATFGPGGDGFVRLNFGCPRSMLAEALERIGTALKTTA
jgi:cysteine-S-conjugate beta-lyase